MIAVKCVTIYTTFQVVKGTTLGGNANAFLPDSDVGWWCDTGVVF
jgi:hypothetical protein